MLTCAMAKLDGCSIRNVCVICRRVTPEVLKELRNDWDPERVGSAMILVRLASTEGD